MLGLELSLVVLSWCVSMLHVVSAWNPPQLTNEEGQR